MMVEEEILKLLRKYGPLTRDQIAKITGIPRTTIHNKLTKLLQKRKVKKRAEKSGRRGRPKIYWEPHHY